MIVNDIVHVAAESSDTLHNTDTQSILYGIFYKFETIYMNNGKYGSNIYKTL